MNDSAQRLKVLLSEGSSTSARQTVYGLGRRYKIDVLDPSRWCQCRFSSLVHRWHRCPVIAKEPMSYVAFLAEHVKKRRYDVLFPTHEQAYLICKYRDLFSDDVSFAVPQFNSLQRLQSKAEFTRLCRELEFPIPQTFLARTQSELESNAFFPGYLKLAHGTASFGVQLVNDLTDLRAALQRFKKEGSWSEGEEVLLQQPAAGRQSVVNAVFQNGRFVASHCSEILETGIGGGVSTRISAFHPVVNKHLRHLGKELNWHGPLFLDYFYDCSSQQPQYIEANPRIGETVNAQLCGVNLCELVVQLSLGKKVDEVAPGRTGVKSHTDFIALLAHAYNGSNRRQLLGHVYRRWRRTGIYACENEITRPRDDLGSLIPEMAVSLRLLAMPRSARRLSQKTVENYSLPQSAVSSLPD